MSRSIRLLTFFCSVIALCFLIPTVVLPQQPPPPSVLLGVSTAADSQIGGSVEDLGDGPSTVDLVAFFQGTLVQPIALSRITGTAVTPLYDETEVPNGPKRVVVTYAGVTLPAGVTIIPGFVGSFLPARLGADLTAEQFLASYVADYTLTVNGFRFMDQDLLVPANVVKLGPVTNMLFPTLPPGDFYIWGLNVTMKLDDPGTYVIRNRMRIPKTILVPELNAAFLAGEFINEITVSIPPPGSSPSVLPVTPEGPVFLGGLPPLDMVNNR